MSNLKGDTEGVKLWKMMASSTDDQEQAYFKRVNDAATKYGSAWFTDIVAQRDTGKNQAWFFIAWSKGTSQWSISLFHVPNGESREIKPRWEEIDPSLIEEL